MRIFKTRLFTKWSKKEKISDDLLRQSVYEMEQGLVDANLGGHVFKKRLPIKGQGKRGVISQPRSLTANFGRFLTKNFSALLIYFV
jgi:hypothetical protein